MFKLLTFIIYTFTTEACKVLSLSGGGPLGAFEIGIASTLMERYGGDWNIITGVSAGSINAAYLSTIEKGQEKLFIEDYKNLWFNTTNNQVYSPTYFLNGKSLYDTKPLKNTLSKVFEGRNPIRPVLISATSLVTGRSELFSEIDIQTHGFTDIIMSSTAIPIYFPPYEFKNNLYVDGGLSSNILVYEGINYCLKNFPNESISIDAIVCGKKIKDYPDITKKNNIVNIASRLIDIIFQQVEYYEILNTIMVSNPNINITIYEEREAIDVGIADFNKSKYLWNQGYNFTNVNIYTDIVNYF